MGCWLVLSRLVRIQQLHQGSPTPPHLTSPHGTSDPRLVWLLGVIHSISALLCGCEARTATPWYAPTGPDWPRPLYRPAQRAVNPSRSFVPVFGPFGPENNSRKLRDFSRQRRGPTRAWVSRLYKGVMASRAAGAARARRSGRAAPRGATSRCPAPARAAARCWSKGRGSGGRGRRARHASSWPAWPAWPAWTWTSRRRPPPG